MKVTHDIHSNLTFWVKNTFVFKRTRIVFIISASALMLTKFKVLNILRYFHLRQIPYDSFSQIRSQFTDLVYDIDS